MNFNVFKELFYSILFYSMLATRLAFFAILLDIAVVVSACKFPNIKLAGTGAKRAFSLR